MYIYNFFNDFIRCLYILQYMIQYDTQCKNKNKKSTHDLITMLGIKLEFNLESLLNFLCCKCVKSPIYIYIGKTKRTSN